MKDGIWNDKISFILKLYNRPMTASEIVTVMEEYQPDWERKKLMTSVSATISAAIGSLYKKVENGITLM
jgi:hypothetical protein